jgi:hypothetical protein
VQLGFLNRGDQNRRYFKQVAMQTGGCFKKRCSKRDRRKFWGVFKKGSFKEEVIQIAYRIAVKKSASNRGENNCNRRIVNCSEQGVANQGRSKQGVIKTEL